MPRRPRLIDLLPARPKRRPLVTQDDTTIPLAKPTAALCYGEPLRIAGAPLALDARPKRPRAVVTFDGAIPTPKD